MSAALTPWFDGAVHKPARVGVYMQMSGESIGYQYWAGLMWHAWAQTVDGAAYYRNGAIAARRFQNDNWRGLAVKP